MTTDAVPPTTAPPLISFRDLLATIRRHWRVVVTAPLIGLLIATLWTMAQPARYTSTASALVSIGSGDNIGVALTADNLAKSKARQYAELGRSRSVAENALSRVNADISTSEALEDIEVSNTEQSAQLTIRATASSPELAQQLASAWVAALGEQVASLESGNLTSPAPGAPTSSSPIRVAPLSDATLPGTPSSPNAPLALALGFLAGLAIGLLYALVRKVLDNRVRSARALEERFGLTILGTIPEVSGSRRGGSQAQRTHTNRVMMNHDESSLTASEKRARFRTVESFKELRTNIQFLRPDHAPRAVTITSSHPAEGKSSVASNLALALAQSGTPVVLVDGDLRRPVLAKSFGLVEGVGVTDVVLGQASVDDVLQYLPDVPGFALLGAGRVPPNPSEIVASDRFNNLIRELSGEAFVVIDAPPLLPVTDAAIMARRFDGCILVVSAGRSTFDELEKVVSSVHKIQGEILGAVLNRVPTSGSEASSYQYYGDSYYSSTTGDQSPTRGRRKLFDRKDPRS
ncbi:polysaccharide biosynthesis tyrosine autokinase [Micrococcus sp.]|uniref:polysaccharide biosynthesis tyrosine autokinase n=1 Tax=Micrococcus sp. TaxID=1271 RepID=UPI002A90918B|nr:polysaccharide biosynthesis tyrosine autokinase [Micrococcus sp.]MDY6054837.1 polysaccharide biosynthesis tyrosine autokinase [Micrococcus sp.]